MADPSSTADEPDGPPEDRARGTEPTAAGVDEDDRDSETDEEDRDRDLEALRREVEETYDFDDFGPADMAEMTAEEWEAAFDPETWIVGRELLDRVERELYNLIASREVFAVVERIRQDGEERVLAYSDEGYALVYPDGTVEGRGTVLRDVKPVVALCSMDSYEVAEPPADVALPSPEEVPEGSGEFGNLMLQVVAAAQLLAGLGLAAIWLFTDLIAGEGVLINIVPPAVALFFVLVGLFLFAVVANARLSDRFRAEEYRNRLRAVGLEAGERPEFVPVEDDEVLRALDSGEGRTPEPTEE